MGHRAYDDERYPSGQFVNQNPGDAGIDTWVRADRDIDGTDIVLWHTFGLTHFPRPEDWPIMPVDYAGFVLKPSASSTATRRWTSRGRPPVIAASQVMSASREPATHVNDLHRALLHRPVPLRRPRTVRSGRSRRPRGDR